ncbi:MAG: 6-phosphogluconolactonase [Pseudomonadota bacterium]|nr:6-phosphogluconolactonase [Pseudomonadota bacterium]
MNLHVFSTQEQQVDACINYLISSTQKILQEKSTITIAVSGGKSPIPFFQKLSTADLDFSRVTFTLVDERITSTNSSDSNENLIKTHLLQNQAAAANFIGLMNSAPLKPLNNECMVVEYANKKINNAVDNIDIAILGMGTDGHTASIFPNCPELEQIIDLSHSDSQHKYHLTHPTTAKYSRISLNLSAILEIKHLILNIDGNIKLDVFKEAILGDNPNYPISYVLTRRLDTQVFWHE